MEMSVWTHTSAGARLDTTTKPAVDSVSARRRSGERVRERGFQKSATIRWNEPLSPAFSPLVPRRERGHFSDGGCIKMRPTETGGALAQKSFPACLQPP